MLTKSSAPLADEIPLHHDQNDANEDEDHRVPRALTPNPLSVNSAIRFLKAAEDQLLEEHHTSSNPTDWQPQSLSDIAEHRAFFALGHQITLICWQSSL